MQDRLALQREAACPVGHHALALGGADRLAKIGLWMEAFALATFRRVERNDMVARARLSPRSRPRGRCRRPHAQNGRKHPFRVGTRQHEGVRVADSGGHDLDKHPPARGPSRSTSMISRGLPA